MYAPSASTSSYTTSSTIFSRKQNLPHFTKRTRLDSDCLELGECTGAYWEGKTNQNMATVEIEYIEPDNNHLPIQILRRSCMFVCGFQRELRDTSN